MLQLWSYHTSDFSLLSGSVDHSKSEFFRSFKSVRDSYPILAEKVGTNQITWCYTRYGEFPVTDGRKIEWKLNVPTHAVLAFVDGFTWNRILQIEGAGGTRCLERQWKRQSIDKFPDDRQARSQYIKCKREQFLKAPAPSGDWWNHLFDAEYGEEGVCALLRHPVDPDWVIHPRL